jgi:hypothetical protein
VPSARPPVPGRGELLANARYARRLRAQLRDPLDRPAADREVREALAHRAASFLTVIRDGVYALPGSPYRRLLEHVGAEYGDVEALVAAHGVEGALERLYAQGVRVSLDEFKCRTPLRRGSLELPVSPADFDNPLALRDLRGATGGSRGPARRVFVDLAQTRRDAAHLLRFIDAADLGDRPVGQWRPIPPGLPGVNHALQFAQLGRANQRWFTPIPLRGSSFRSAGFLALTMGVLRASGIRVGWPRHVPLTEAGPVVEWIAASARAGRPPLVGATPSGAVRICQEAARRGAEIAGTVFRLGGEPFTPARARVLRNAGCEGFAFYQLAETGRAGVSCTARSDPDDVHLLEDKLAAIGRTIDAHGASIDDVLVLTGVWRRSPKLLLNVETDDTAILERRECGCEVGAGGLTAHLRQIRSYEKLTGEGMTFTMAFALRLVEEVLPGRFGGAPSDYQLVEDRSGELTRVEVLASPRLGPLDEAAVAEATYAALGENGEGPALMARLWRDASAVRVVRGEPHATPRGKIFAVHVVHERDAQPRTGTATN